MLAQPLSLLLTSSDIAVHVDGTWTATLVGSRWANITTDATCTLDSVYANALCSATPAVCKQYMIEMHRTAQRNASHGTLQAVQLV